MKLYLGSRDIRPEGFLTVDLDPTHDPDILADVTDLTEIASESVDEICASHILEHIPWPQSYQALAEWARVLRADGLLRVAVPDLGLLARLIAEGRNVWWAAGLLFGVGRLENMLEAHQYGYTRDMLTAMLRSLGFGGFAWWKHDLRDGSNGWMLDDAGHRVATSLNIAARKVARPVMAPATILRELMNDRLQPFDVVLCRLLAARDDDLSPIADADPALVQHLHMALIEARMRIVFLENQLSENAARSSAQLPVPPGVQHDRSCEQKVAAADERQAAGPAEAAMAIDPDDTPRNPSTGQHRAPCLAEELTEDRDGSVVKGCQALAE